MNDPVSIALRLGLCAALTLTSAAVAQERTDPAPTDPAPAEVRLQRAIVLEEAEQAYAEAEAAFRAIVDDAGVDAEIRRRARIRYARLLLRKGDESGYRAELALAAVGDTPAAREAQRLLREPVPEGEDAVVRAEVTRLLGGVVTGPDPTRTRDRIRFFGERAVPILVEAIDARSAVDDLRLVEVLAGLVWQIGGDRARDWLGGYGSIEPVFKRRAIAAAAIRAESGPRGSISPDLYPAFRAMFDDPDAEIRLRLAQFANGRQDYERECLPTKAELVPLLVDPDPRVRREAAFGHKWDFAIASVGRGDEEPFGAALVTLLDEAPRTLDDETREAIREWVSKRPWFRADRVSLQVFFGALRHGIEGQALSVPFEGEVPGLAELGLNVGLEEVQDIARRLGPVADPTGSQGAQAALAKAVPLLQWMWNGSSVDAAVDLATMGYGPNAEWFQAMAGRDGWLRILARPQHARITTLLDAFERLGDAKVPEASMVAVCRRVDETLRDAAVRDSGVLQRRLDELVFLICRQASAEAMRFATRVAMRVGLPEDLEVNFGLEAVQGLVAGNGPGHLAVLKFIALSDDRIDSRARQVAVAWCFHRGVEDAADIYRANLAGPDAGYLALSEAAQRIPKLREWNIDFGVPATLLGRIEVGYSDDRLIKILDELLQEGTDLVWNDLLFSRAFFDRANASDEFMIRWTRTISARIEAAPDDRSLQNVVGRLLQALQRSPDGPDPALAAPIARVGNELRRRGLWTIQSRTANSILPRCVEWFPAAPEIHDMLRDLLRSDVDEERRDGWFYGSRCEPDPRVAFLQAGLVDADSVVRTRAYRLAVDLAEGPERVALVRAMLQDPEVSPTNALPEVRELLDPSLVPDVLPLLRHENEEIREAAQATLDAIDYYVTQERRWKRLLAAGGLDAPSAAEALITQAGADQPKEVRLLALESLGTLAVAETLPFLIGLVQDDDAEIAAAARAAIRRVHERAAPAQRAAPPRTPAGGDGDPASPDRDRGDDAGRGR